LDHPIPNTNDAESIQIIVPAKQLDRHSDTYISMVSHSHLICAPGIYVAIVSATVETSDPASEIQPALELLGPILECFVSVSELYSPIENGAASNLWITRSYDPTSHFETAGNDVLEIYEQIVGEKLDLNIEQDEEDDY